MDNQGYSTTSHAPTCGEASSFPLLGTQQVQGCFSSGFVFMDELKISRSDLLNEFIEDVVFLFFWLCIALHG